MQIVGIDRGTNKTFRFGQKEYKFDDIFAIIDAEDAVAASTGRAGSGGGGSADGSGSGASAEAGGSGTDRSDGGGDHAGQDGGGSAGPSAGGTAERKGPHCMVRLVGILVEDDVRPLLIGSRLQANREQLDVSAVGSRSEVWQLAARRFRDPDHEVRRGGEHCSTHQWKDTNIYFVSTILLCDFDFLCRTVLLFLYLHRACAVLGIL